MSRVAHLARLEQSRLLTLERRGKARREAYEIAAGVAETVALSAARGAEFETPEPARGERERPYRRQVGLDWLTKKGRITPAQKAAGERYGLCYRRARAEIAIASTLDVQPGGGGASSGTPLASVLARAEARVQAGAKLVSYRRQLSDQNDLVAACDLICGEEQTPREAARSERDAGRLEAILGVALDILAAAR
jgi:hypothetical protein